jgi:arginine-tRNA-protein transferase
MCLGKDRIEIEAMTGQPTHEERTVVLGSVLERRAPPPGEPFPCPYRPGRLARHVTLVPYPLAPGLYHSMMDLNFRRLGPVFYRPSCDGCDACRMIRVPTAEFHPSRSQRRCWKRNADVTVEVLAPDPTEEKRLLYRRYLESRHDGQMDGSPDEFYGFLYGSDVETVEIEYRLGSRLLAVGITDVEPGALSAVYCYFDPAESSRGLGVFNVLWTIEECRRRGVPHLYLGYYVTDCRRMNYKALYRPSEVLGPDQRWSRLAAAG